MKYLALTALAAGLIAGSAQARSELAAPQLNTQAAEANISGQLKATLRPYNIRYSGAALAHQLERDELALIREAEIGRVVLAQAIEANPGGAVAAPAPKAGEFSVYSTDGVRLGQVESVTDAELFIRTGDSPASELMVIPTSNVEFHERSQSVVVTQSQAEFNAAFQMGSR